jgi:UTP:GlnB (protein PII) uridylyltransferase
MSRTILSVGFGVLLALAMAVPAAHADASNQASRLTFSQAVQLPNNVVLPAGTYWFTVPDSITTPNLIRVWNSDRSSLVTQMLAVSADRMNSTEHTQLTLSEQGKNQPLALMQWYYPDRLIGHEFVYSPRRERELAENAHITVHATTAPQG